MALNNNTWLDVEDVSNQYGIAPSTQAKYRRERRIPFVKVGSFIRYKREELDSWLDSHAVRVEMVVC